MGINTAVYTIYRYIQAVVIGYFRMSIYLYIATTVVNSCAYPHACMHVAMYILVLDLDLDLLLCKTAIWLIQHREVQLYRPI